MYLKKMVRRDANGHKIVGAYTHVVPMNKSKTFSKLWNPSPRYIHMGLSEGWLKREEDTFRFITAPDQADVVYRIDRAPLTREDIEALPPGPVPRANQYICERVG